MLRKIGKKAFSLALLIPLLVSCSLNTDNAANDEKLLREVLYEGQQISENAKGLPDDYRKNWNYSIDNLFPPIREYITDEAFAECLESDLQNFQFFTVGFMSLEVGSSVEDADWETEVEGSDGVVKKTFKPSDYGRTYLVRVKIFKAGFFAGDEERDIHYTVMDGKAYIFQYNDECVDFKN